MRKNTTEIYDVVPVFAVDETGKALITEEQYSWLCNYAVRKAERVQELDELVMAYQTELSIKDNANKRIKKKNKRYRATINAMGQIFKDAIHSLDVGEKVQGLEYGVKMRDEALEERK